MKCFNHVSADAIGTCKSCGKGLCRECFTDLGKGLACRSRCEEDVRSLIEVIDRNVRYSSESIALVRSTRQTFGFVGALFLASGALALGLGLWSDTPMNLLTIVGVFLAAFGLFYLTRFLIVPRTASSKAPS